MAIKATEGFPYLAKVRLEFYSHIRGEYFKKIDPATPITLEELKSMRMNSYEQKALIPLFTDEAFLWFMEQCFNNTRTLGQYQLPRHYDEFLATDGVRELHKRLKSRIEAQDREYEAGLRDMLEQVEDGIVQALMMTEDRAEAAESSFERQRLCDKVQTLLESFAYATGTAVGGMEYNSRLSAAQSRVSGKKQE